MEAEGQDSRYPLGSESGRSDASWTDVGGKPGAKSEHALRLRRNKLALETVEVGVGPACDARELVSTVLLRPSFVCPGGTTRRSQTGSMFSAEDETRHHFAEPKGNRYPPLQILGREGEWIAELPFQAIDPRHLPPVAQPVIVPALTNYETYIFLRRFVFVF